MPRPAAVIMLGLVLAGSMGCGRAPAPGPIPSRDAAHTTLLAQNPGWRLAEPADCRSELLAEFIEAHPGYHPYQLLGDVNEDGRLDLAVALVERDASGSRFQVYWFRGAARGFDAPQPLGVTALADGGIVPMPGGLYLGPFFSDAGDFYRWNRATRRLEPHDPFTE